jgi:hypothetical protein
MALGWTPSLNTAGLVTTELVVAGVERTSAADVIGGGGR